MTTLNYSTATTNREFRIKVSGYDKNGNKVHKLVGVKGLLELVEVELVNKQLDRAFASGADKCVCKLRRGIKIVYYSK